jgi:spermidine synthase
MDTLSHLAFSFSSIEPIETLMACAVAIGIGVLFARKQARAFKGHDKLGLPIVTFADYGDMRFLHLGTPWVQGSMKISKPYDIHLEYVQRMMGWLLFTDLDQVRHLHAMQLGLGAGALTKFCHLQLSMQTTAVELNPQVVATCRSWFKLPEDNAKLQVLLADAAEIASQQEWHGKIDVLQVDLYDQEAACPALDSEAFYADCRQLLTQQGCMAVNVYGRDSNLETSIQRIAMAFGKDALWAFKPTTAGNSIVLAFRTPCALDKNALLSQARQIQARWSLPATKWLSALTPMALNT